MHRDSEYDANPILTLALQGLSTALALPRIMEIVRQTAREIVGADGATFVLKDGEFCFYADEDAIGPLWKGRRFPQTSCISGWAMMYRKPAVIENIFEDPRIPVDVYRATFVRSLVMVPVGERLPIAAIGVYWAKVYRATPIQLGLLQTLARATNAAIEKLSPQGETSGAVGS
ncbi:MAG: GAF domain-containing protein [Verrucomicrobiota bacterium]